MDKEILRELDYDSAPIRPYTIPELADLYGQQRRTMLRWIERHKKDVGSRVGHYYNVRQVAIIFNKLGPPSKKT